MKILKIICTQLILLSISLNALAYYTVQDTGDLLKPGRYAAGAELQFLTSPNSGANFNARFDGAMDDEFNYRGYVGFGEVDFIIGGQIKWVPFPDVDNQPAIGFVGGALVANNQDYTEITIRAYPIISKNFPSDVGTFTPYGALPIGFRNYRDNTDTPVQLVLGTRYIHDDYKGAHGFFEFSSKLDDSVSYFSLGVSFPLDADNKFNLQP